MVDFVNIILNVLIVTIVAIILWAYFSLTSRYKSNNIGYCVKSLFIDCVTEAAEYVLGPIKQAIDKISELFP